MTASLVAAWLLLPLFPLVLVLAGLYALRAKPRTGRALIAGGAGLMLLLSIPVVGSLLIATLEAPFVDPYSSLLTPSSCWAAAVMRTRPNMAATR